MTDFTVTERTTTIVVTGAPDLTATVITRPSFLYGERVTIRPEHIDLTELFDLGVVFADVSGHRVKRNGKLGRWLTVQVALTDPDPAHEQDRAPDWVRNLSYDAP